MSDDNKKVKAPRNKTIDLSTAEVNFYRTRLRHLHNRVDSQEIKNRTINQDLFEVLDYLPTSFVDLLIIDKQEKLQKELHKYEQKNQEESYIIKGKLQEREEEIKSLKQKYENDMNMFQEKVERKIQELFQKIDIQKIK